METILKLINYPSLKTPAITIWGPKPGFRISNANMRVRENSENTY